MKKHAFLIKTLVFLLLLMLVVGGVSYVFRLKSLDAETSIVGFYDEPKNTLDGVYIGASNVYWYWQAPIAYQYAGVAVMDYATGSLPYTAFAGVLRESMKRQSPRLVLIDPRSFTGDGEPDAFGVHNLFDFMPASVNKYKTLKTVCDGAHVDASTRLEYYVPFVRFHYIWEELDASCFRRDASPYKNAVFNTDVLTFVTDYTGEMVFSEDVAPVTGVHLDALNELLDVCDTLSCPVLFVTSPMLDDAPRKAQMNYIGQFLEERGYPFLNCNDRAVYEQIGLAVPTDFYDAAHVNIWGSMKYTRFLTDYIQLNYALPDRRGDAAYATWDKAYADYAAYVESVTGKALDVSGK